jgi:hypothetical protein
LGVSAHINKIGLRDFLKAKRSCPVYPLQKKLRRANALP